MKKLLILPVLALILGFSGPVSAAQCGDITLNHPASETVDPVTFATTTISAVNFLACGGGSPENVQSAWGINSDVPHLALGQFATDEAGTVGICPTWFPIRGCVDIFRTPYYRNAAIETARQLKTNGFLSAFPAYQYWANFIK